MNRHTPLLFLFLLTLIAMPIYAQEAEVPWPPRPAEIFTDAVELVEMTVTPEFDNEARTVRVYDVDTQVWETFAYPEAFDRVEYITIQNGKVAVSVVEQHDYPENVPQWTPWTLDTPTGEFAHYESPCLNSNAYYDESTEKYSISSMLDRWVFYIDSRFGERTTLCHTSTGEFRGFLPPNAHWLEIFRSPREWWIVLLGEDDRYAGRGGDWQVHIYDLATDTVHYLGNVPRRDHRNFERWVSDTQGVFYSGYMPESMEKEYFAFDVMQPDGLVVFTGWSRYFDNPPRYEFIETNFEFHHRADSPDYIPCTAMVYDMATHQTNDFVLAQDCLGDVERANNQYFYVSSSEAREELALYSLDITTRQKTKWVSRDGLVGLESVSPDGRYAALVFDNGQWIDYRDLDPFYFDIYLPDTLWVEIYDMMSGEWVYRTDDWSGRAYWFAENAFFLDEWDGSSHSARVFRLEEDGVSETRVDNIISSLLPLSGGTHHLFVSGSDSGVSSYNLLNGVEMPLIYPFDDTELHPTMERSADENLILLFRRNTQAGDTQFARYVIRLP